VTEKFILYLYFQSVERHKVLTLSLRSQLLVRFTFSYDYRRVLVPPLPNVWQQKKTLKTRVQNVYDALDLKSLQAMSNEDHVTVKPNYTHTSRDIHAGLLYLTDCVASRFLNKR